MILEGLITTLDADGAMHLAPMGPAVDGPDFRRFLLRPFPSSATYRNLAAHGEGVLHVTDDSLLLARAAIGDATARPSHVPAQSVRGWVLCEACRAYEFRVASLDSAHERVRIECEVVRVERLRDFFGFNRAKHAVVEAAILATRTAILPVDAIRAEFARLRPLVEKTGGPDEVAAFELLARHVEGAA